MGKKQDIPGNVIATQAIIQRQALKVAAALDWLDYSIREDDEREIWVIGLRVKFPEHEGEDYLVVMKGDSNKGNHVAFHAADGLAEALRGAAERYKNKKLVWKEDQYAG